MTEGRAAAESASCGLSDEDIRQEEAFLRGVPFLNVGALFMPPIWGVAHGDWICVLFYPAWLFCDNLFYAAYSAPSVLSVVLAVVCGLVLTAVTFVYARISSPRSAHRAAARGIARERYLRTERFWAVGMVILGVIMIAAATWYNLCIRSTVPVG
ncbi:MAG: viscotoxin-A3 [Coriobacteriia bacterium]|nr:viscotoxin-A3 [Coriobacteriia bacterium]